MKKKMKLSAQSVTVPMQTKKTDMTKQTFPTTTQSTKKSYSSYGSYYRDRDNKDLSNYNTLPAPSVKMDIELYKSLLTYRAHSGSKTQTRYKKYIQNLLNSMPDVRTWIDKAGNLYCIKGNDKLTVPCIVSHLDINQSHITGEAMPIFAKDWIIGINNASGLQCGLGHDDKAGNLFAIQAIKHFPDIRAIFTIDEEIGGKGAYAADINFFDNCSFLAQLDRNAYEGPEFITYSGGIHMCSDEFMYDIAVLMDEYNFVEADGIFTDVNCLKSIGALPSAFNLTAGYYNEHSSEEVLYIPAWENSASFVYELIAKFGAEKYPHRPHVKYDKWSKGLMDFDNEPLTSWHEKQDFSYMPGVLCTHCGIESIIESQYSDKDYCDTCASWQ